MAPPCGTYGGGRQSRIPTLEVGSRPVVWVKRVPGAVPPTLRLLPGQRNNHPMAPGLPIRQWAAVPAGIVTAGLTLASCGEFARFEPTEVVFTNADAGHGDDNHPAVADAPPPRRPPQKRESTQPDDPVPLPVPMDAGAKIPAAPDANVPDPVIPEAPDAGATAEVPEADAGILHDMDGGTEAPVCRLEVRPLVSGM